MQLLKIKHSTAKDKKFIHNHVLHQIITQADAEADPYAYHYSSVSTPYAHYGTFVPDQIPHHPVVAHVAAPVAHGYGHFGHYGYPYGGYFGHHGYPYFG